MATLLLFIIIFGIVVISHEFGHYLLAKLNGIHVVEFSIGMGPSIFSFQKGETRYSLKLFPIGGACMFEGEDGVVERDGTGYRAEQSTGSFVDASVWSRISTVSAGPFFNLILALVVAFIMVNMSDTVAILDPVISQVVEGGSAEAAGLKAGDRIISLDGERIRLYQEISMYMQLTYQGGPVDIVYERDGNRGKLSLLPKVSEETGIPMLGVMNNQYVEPKGVQTLRYAWYEMRYSVKATYKSLGMLLRGRVSRKDVAGPIGIAVNVVGKTYEATKEYGWKSVMVNMMNIMLMLSVNLGILNLLPIPALDGGRMVFLCVELLRGKPIPPQKEGIVHFVGFVLLMVLMVFVFFNDLANIFFH